MGRGSALASQINQALADVATPAPADERDEGYLLASEDNAASALADADLAAPGASSQAANDVDDAQLVGEDAGALGAAEGMATEAAAPQRPSGPPSSGRTEEASSGMSPGLILALILMVLALGAATIWGPGVFGSTPSVEKPAPEARQEAPKPPAKKTKTVSYTHLRAHET